MNDLTSAGSAFLAMARRIVWCAVAGVDRQGRPRSRVMHPIWSWEGDNLVGYVATSPTALKRGHIKQSPYLSLNYWAENQDNCVAEVGAEWIFDDAGCTTLWQKYLDTPPPMGYDLASIPQWAAGPTAAEFAGLKLTPWALRVVPGGDYMNQIWWRGD